jgi:hypothetical protein
MPGLVSAITKFASKTSGAKAINNPKMISALYALYGVLNIGYNSQKRNDVGYSLSMAVKKGQVFELTERWQLQLWCRVQ